MFKLARFALPALMALALASPLAAQDQPKTPAPIARFSIASLNTIVNLASQMGIQVPPDFISGLESAPFLGKGTVDLDKPMGFVVVAADPQKLFPIPNSVVIGVPVQAGKITLKDLTGAGATPVQGEKDVVNFASGGPPGGFDLRRTDNYLFVKAQSGPFGLSAMNDDVFATEYKQPGTLGVISFNFDTFRKVAPQAYKDAASNITSLPQAFMMGPAFAPPAGGNADTAKATLAAFEKIDRFTLALAQDDKSFHLRSWLMPSPIKGKARELPRPNFPAGMVVQMHAVFPDAQAAGFLEQLAANLQEDSMEMLAPVYRARAKDLLVRAAHTVSGCDGISFAHTMKDGHPVFYFVAQLSQPADKLEEIKGIATETAALSTESGLAHASVDASSYDADGKKVQRLVASDDTQKGKAVIDAIQDGKLLYVTISDNPDGKYVGELAKAGMNGTSSVLCAGVVDLNAAFKAISDSGGMGALTPDKIESLKKELGGQGITWTVQSSDQNFLYVDLAVPTAAAKWVISELQHM